jgi:thiol-disulfide isomerase/thioredoxin
MSQAAHVNLASGDAFIVAVFADWCQHCVKMKPTWSAFVKATPASVVSFDYDTYKKIMGMHECDLSRVFEASVTSFPHVALVRKDPSTKRIAVHVYDGEYPMTMKSLTNFSQKLNM